MGSPRLAVQLAFDGPFVSSSQIHRNARGGMPMGNRLMAAIWRLIIPILPMLWHKQVFRMKRVITREQLYAA